MPAEAVRGRAFPPRLLVLVVLPVILRLARLLHSPRVPPEELLALRAEELLALRVAGSNPAVKVWPASPACRSRSTASASSACLPSSPGARWSARRAFLSACEARGQDGWRRP